LRTIHRCKQKKPQQQAQRTKTYFQYSVPTDESIWFKPYLSGVGTVPIFALRRADEDLARFIEPSVLLCKPCGGSVSQGGRRRGLWAPFRMGCGLQFSGKCESQAEASKCDTLTTQHFVETLQNFVKSRNENNVCLQRSESYRREAGEKSGEARSAGDHSSGL